MSKGILNIDQIEERFFIHGRMEVLDILADLLYRCEPVAFFFEGAAETVPVTLLESGTDGLVFSLPAEFDGALPHTCIFLAFPEGIRVQFQCEVPRRIDWDGARALHTSLPIRLARVQRQESFRTWIAADAAPEVTLCGGDGRVLGRKPLHDLSAGGLGIATQGEWAEDAASRIASVRFSLDAFGEVECAVAVKHSTRIGEDAQHRIGMSFCGLSVEQRARIQRYVTATEYRRRNAQQE